MAWGRSQHGEVYAWGRSLVWGRGGGAQYREGLVMREELVSSVRWRCDGGGMTSLRSFLMGVLFMHFSVSPNAVW